MHVLLSQHWVDALAPLGIDFEGWPIAGVPRNDSSGGGSAVLEGETARRLPCDARTGKLDAPIARGQILVAVGDS